MSICMPTHENVDKNHAHDRTHVCAHMQVASISALYRDRRWPVRCADMRVPVLQMTACPRRSFGVPARASPTACPLRGYVPARSYPRNGHAVGDAEMGLRQTSRGGMLAKLSARVRSSGGLSRSSTSDATTLPSIGIADGPALYRHRRRRVRWRVQRLHSLGPSRREMLADLWWTP